jgi:hypothetical protein
MIAVVSDALDPAPDHTLITSVTDYLNFVRNTNNIAYRNMDVVDMVAGTPGVVEAEVRNMPRTRERFKLRIDLGRFVPGAIVRVRGPVGALRGANPRGLKLLAVKEGQNIYDVLVGKERTRNLAFLGAKEPALDAMPGFDDVLVEKDFRLVVDYVLPDKDILQKVFLDGPRVGYTLAIRQIWNGEVVGAVAVLLIPPARREKPAERIPERTKRRRSKK